MDIDTTFAHRGQRSLHLAAGPQWEGRATITVEGSALPAGTEDRHFGRLMSYVPEASPDGVHWNHIVVGGHAQDPRIQGGAAFEAELALGGMHAGRWLANFDTPGGYDGSGPQSDCWQDSSAAFPVGRWACIEWAVDRKAGRIELWVDGLAVPSMTVQGHGEGCVHPWPAPDWGFPRLERLVIGWMEFGDHAGPRELWIDEVALSSTRMGCP